MILSLIIFILYSNYQYFLGMIGWYSDWIFWFMATVVFVLFNIFPSFKKFPTTRLKRIQRGVILLVLFLITCVVDVGMLIWAILSGSDVIFANSLHAFYAGNVIFWNGIIRVYLSSKQLGIKWRVIGLLCGMIPIAHLIALGYIISITMREYKEETARFYLNQSREQDMVCATKYPILLVHGVFFRDSKHFNYWGRIPEDLQKNGAVVYYGNQESTASVDVCGRQVAERIKEIVETTGCEKVNIIAHSKGGLDSRAAITIFGAAPYVASLTTINTPHRGCLFAEYLLNKAPEGIKKGVSNKYNAAMRKVGDRYPDFLMAVTDLTQDACKKFNDSCPDVEGIYYQSVGSRATSARGGRFPLNLSYNFVRKFDGPNDGLVAVPSMKWGSDFTYVTPTRARGITHADMIDLNRENIDGFDVRETYVQLVSNLKQRGL
ncbi:triacylglycerol lipase [Ruminococcaceae bacterium YRB3002]|nr:triacylglycerol lipase [Ruminococcaceae bacterium YRB3002]